MIAPESQLARSLLAAAALTLSGCLGSASPTATPTPSPTLAPSAAAKSTLPITGEIVVAEWGYRLTLPEGWMRIDLDADIAALVGNQVAGGPDPTFVVDYLRGNRQSLIDHGGSLLAYEMDDTDPRFVDSASVLTGEGSGITLDMIETGTVSRLESLAPDIANVTARRVLLPHGEAVLIAYEIHRPEPITAVAFRQYTFVGNSIQYILNVQGLPDDATFVGDADSIAATFGLVDDH